MFYDKVTHVLASLGLFGFSGHLWTEEISSET
jgi:hypothetical protein